MTRSTHTPFTDFFDSSDKQTVVDIVKKCRDYAQRSSETMTYIFGADDCSDPERDIAYVIPGSSEEYTIYLCSLFEGLPKAKYWWWNKYNTKFEAIVHEMTHLFAFTLDNGDKGYGYDNCKALDKKVGLFNADNYGFYIQQVFYHNRKY